MKSNWTYHTHVHEDDVEHTIRWVNDYHQDWDIVSVIARTAYRTVIVHREPIE